jgi:coenzyme F420-reducing hydrogenase beta subunit
LSTKPKVFGHLLVEVIRSGRCVACGSCVSVCPVDAISFVDGVPKLTGKCTACGTCYTSCPRTDHDFSGIESEAMGRIRGDSEGINGVIKGAYAVRALDPELAGRVQDGGAATSLLLSMLDSGCVVEAGRDEKKVWSPDPRLAKTRNDIIACSGTKYTSAPMLLALKEAEKKGEKVEGFVGTPCQIHALRRREKNKKTGALAVGLFCMETFDYAKLMEYLNGQGVDPAKVEKFEIRSGMFIARRKGDAPFEVKIKKLKELSRPCCRVCQDYTSELADVSIGNVGSPPGFSTVLVRTEKGEEALRHAEKRGLIEVKPLSDYQPGMSLVDRLSSLKKKENSVSA